MERAYRPHLDLDALSPEARNSIERTEMMLSDFDSHSGPFASAAYDAMPTFLDLPFAKECKFSRAEVWKILDVERLWRLTGYPMPDGHVQQYDALRDAAKAWIEKTGYERLPTSLRGGTFPFIKKHIQHIRTVLTQAGMLNVQSSGGGGYQEVRFDFPAAFFGTMRGLIEIRTKYDGDIRFNLTGGFLASGTTVFMGRHTDLTGALHYILCGFDVPRGMKFVADREDTTEGIDNMLKIVLGITSYYKI